MKLVRFVIDARRQSSLTVVLRKSGTLCFSMIMSRPLVDGIVHEDLRKRSLRLMRQSPNTST